MSNEFVAKILESLYVKSVKISHLTQFQSITMHRCQS